MDRLQKEWTWIADLNSGNPFADSILTPFAVHDTGAPAAPEKSIDVILSRCFAEMGNLLTGGNVVGADESVEKGHWYDVMVVRNSQLSSRHKNMLCLLLYGVVIDSRRDSKPIQERTVPKSSIHTVRVIASNSSSTRAFPEKGTTEKL